MLETLGLALFHHRDAARHSSGLLLGDWPSSPGTRIEIDENGLHVSSDTEGSLHVYRTETSKLAVGTRIEDVLDYTERDLDPEGFEELLALGYVLSDRTIFKTVSRLGAAKVMTIPKGTSEKRRITHHDLELPDPGSPEKALERVAKRTAELCKDGGILELSGGFDSRVVLALAIHGGGSSIAAFTLGNTTCADSVSASKLAEAASLDLHIFDHPEISSPSKLLQQGQLMASGGGYMLNFSEYAGFPLLFDKLKNLRTGQINGLGGEIFTGFFDTPGDELASRFGPTRRAWIRQRLINNVHNFQVIWPGSEGRHRMNGVIRRIEREILSYSGNCWRDKTSEFYRLTRMRNWGGAVVSSSSHWYSVHSPLWSRDFQTWSLATKRYRKRSGQRELTNRLCPIFESIPYQTELEKKAEFKAQMQRTSSKLLGKIILRILRRSRLRLGPAVNNDRLLRQTSVTSDLMKDLSKQDCLGGGRFEKLINIQSTQSYHSLGVAMTTGLAMNPNQSRA